MSPYGVVVRQHDFWFKADRASCYAIQRHFIVFSLDEFYSVIRRLHVYIRAHQL